MVTNAKQVVASVQDVAKKLAEYAKFRGETKYPGISLLIYLVLSFSIMIRPQIQNPTWILLTIALLGITSYSSAWLR